MSYRVLIADDEPMVRADLRETVLSALPEAEIVGEAEDGEEAYALVAERRPDILFVDIRMPFLSGLDLIRKLRDLDEERITIVVTGHDEFEYAREALSLGVFEFLLKPIEAEAYAAALGRARAAIDAARDEGAEKARIARELSRHLPYLRRSLLSDLASGRADAAEAVSRLSVLRLDIPEATGLTLARLGASLPGRAAAPGRRPMDTELAFLSIVEEVLEPFGVVETFPDEADGILALSGAGGGAAWADVPAEIASRAERRLGLATTVAQRVLRGGPAAFAAGLRAAVEDLDEEAGRSTEPVVDRARSYVEQHYMRPDLSLEDAATDLGVSADRLSRLLKRETGRSFVDYLNVYRITRAMAMMANSSLRLFEVAELAGFANQHYFSRVFRKVSGLSPSEYRAEASP